MTDRAVNMLRAVEVVALVLSVLVSIGILFVATGFETQVEIVGVLLYVWTIVPFVVFFAISRALYRRKPTRTLPLTTCTASVLMLGVAVVVYADAILIDPSSDVLTVFIFVPLVLLIGGPLMVGVSRLIGTRS